MLKALPYAIAAIAVVGALYAVYSLGISHEKQSKLADQNKALIEYVKQQKEITDVYAPILGKLKTKPKRAVDPVIDYAIDSLPN